MLIIRKSKSYTALPGRDFEHAIHVIDGPAVTVMRTIGPGVPQGGNVPCNIFDRPSRPRVGHGLRFLQEMEKAFEVCIEDRAGNSIRLERSGKLRYAGRRLAGFRNRRKDEEHEALCRMRDAMARAFVGDGSFEFLRHYRQAGSGSVKEPFIR